MTVIRGATTVEKDDQTAIKLAVKSLLDEIFAQNNLKAEWVRCIVFSLTSDLHAYHPAKAARESGYDFAPLFCCLEPDIEGGLPQCIRVMLFIEDFISAKGGRSDESLREAPATVKHIYQERAKALRKDITEIYNVALDGPAGSGKSTIAKILAKDYNILYLDTGAMYRACGLKALKNGIDPRDGEAVEKMLKTLDLKVQYKVGAQRTLLDGEDVSLAIRENAVSMAASNVSAHHAVRVKMVEMQREIARSMSCVLDGRDIGSAVLPNAKFKFYITADSTVRATRRYNELKARGQEVDFEKLRQEIELRDKQDMEREFSPLVCAEDAVLVDTSSMTVEEVVAYLKMKIQEKI